MNPAATASRKAPATAARHALRPLTCARACLLALTLAGSAAFADEPPPNLCGAGARVGNACSTDDGSPGRCEEVSVHGNYPDARGVYPTWKELICVPSVTAAHRALLPWLGVGLGFLALVLGLATRKPPPPRVQSPT